MACSKSTVRFGAGRRHRQQVERGRVVGHPLALNREGSPPLDDDVDGQAVKPGRERRVAAKLSQLLPGPDENVLCDLVGFLRAEHPSGQAVNPRHVGAVEALEGRLVPTGRQGHVVRRARYQPGCSPLSVITAAIVTVPPLTTDWTGSAYRRLIRVGRE